MFAFSSPCRVAPAVLIALAVWPAAAQATSFGPPIALPGVPPGSTISGAFADSAGQTTLVGTRPAGDLQRAFVTFVAAGGAPTTARAIGPAAAFTTPPRVAGAWNGSATIVFAAGNSAYLSSCTAGDCAPTTQVSRSSLAPEPSVAVNAATGRATVLLRGRTASGAARLQWRVTTGGRLGPVHTLGELGDDARLAADLTGKVVAV